MLLKNKNEVYLGGFLNDEYHKGKLHINGNIYEGEFKNNKFNGKGIYKFQCGDVYVGSFIDGLKNGKGKFEYYNGNFYEGEF
jgi:hypothetical protein